MAVLFNATTDALSRTTNLPTITSYTLMCWIRTVGTVTTQNFLAFGDSTGGFYAQIFRNVANNFRVYGGSAGVSGSAIAQNTWYHVALTCSGTGANLLLGYLNGVLDITATQSTSTSAEKLWIGNDNDTEDMEGQIAAVKIYSAVLTAAEIQQEKLFYMPVRTANLNAWYPLLSTADDEIDFSGNGYTLTVGGTLTTDNGPPIQWRRGQSRVRLPAAAAATVNLDTWYARTSNPVFTPTEVVSY